MNLFLVTLNKSSYNLSHVFTRTAADHLDYVVAVSIIPQREIDHVLVTKSVNATKKNFYNITENLIGCDLFSVDDKNSKSLTMPCFHHC